MKMHAPSFEAYEHAEFVLERSGRLLNRGELDLSVYIGRLTWIGSRTHVSIVFHAGYVRDKRFRACYIEKFSNRDDSGRKTIPDEITPF